MSAFDLVFTNTLALEGNFTDDPTDRGGATKYGITERTARANGYAGPMRELPLSEASRIAKSQYWDTLRLDEISALSQDVAKEVFDTAYNMGVGTAGRILQRSLNALNRRTEDYGDLTVDGVVGPATVSAFRAYLERRKTSAVITLLKALNVLQGAAYFEIVERNPEQEKFLFGWLLNRVQL